MCYVVICVVMKHYGMLWYVKLCSSHFDLLYDIALSHVVVYYVVRCYDMCRHGMMWYDMF